MLNHRKSLVRTTHMRRVSSKRAAQNREYTIKRRDYLALNPYCEVWMREHNVSRWEVDMCDGVINEGGKKMVVPRSVEIHHVWGRIGVLLNDSTKWLAISRFYHDKIHRNPSWAREKGYLK